MKNKKGFTLVELLAVIAILAILVVIALPNVIRMFRNAKKDSFENELKKIAQTAENQWMNNSLTNVQDIAYARSGGIDCPNALDLTGRTNIDYYIEINSSGKIVKYYATDGTYVYVSNVYDLNINDIGGVEEINDENKIEITCSNNDIPNQPNTPVQPYTPVSDNPLVTYNFTDLNDMRLWKYNLPETFTVDYNSSNKMNSIHINTKSGWEAIYLPITTVKNKHYYFEFDYENPNGYKPYSTYDGIAAQILKNFSSSNNISNQIAVTYLDSSAISGAKHFVIDFVAQGNTTYLTFNFGYVADSNKADVKLGNFKLSQEVVQGEQVSSIVTPTLKDGYHFDGYYTSEIGGTKLDPETILENKYTEYYARYLPNEYTIKFNSNGGSGSMADLKVKYDEEKKLSKNTYTRANYSFVEWNTDKDGLGTSYQDEATIKNLTATNNGTITFYAQWKSNYKLTYDLNTLTNFNVWSFVGKSRFTKLDYNESTNFNDVTVNTVNGTWENIYLQVETVKGKRYSLEFDYINSVAFQPYGGNPGLAVQVLKSVSDSDNKSNQLGVDYIIGTASPDTKHMKIDFIASSNKAYLAFNFGYVADSKTMSIKVGNIKLNQDITPGEQVTNIATPILTGYTFNGYYSSKTGGTKLSTTTVSPTADSTYYARYTVNKYHLVFNKNGGSGSMSNQTINYNETQNIRSNTFTKDYYSFLFWNTKSDRSGTKYENNQSVINLSAKDDDTINLYAQWRSNYRLTFDFGPMSNMKMWNYLDKQRFEVEYDESTEFNTITVNTVNGSWENIYLAFNTIKGEYYSFDCDYIVPTSFTTYSSSYPGIAVQALSKISSSDNKSNQLNVAYIPKTQSDGTKHLSFEFVATGATTYIGFNYGYVDDYKTVSIKVGNVSLTQDLKPNEQVGNISSPLLPSGYTFDGYYDSKTGGNKLSSSSTLPASNKTYYARYTAN